MRRKIISPMKTSHPQAPKIETVSSPAFDFSTIASLPETTFQTFLQTLPAHLPAHLVDIWEFCARKDQLPPKGQWLIWLLLGGRGAGKTRTGAEWVREQVQNGGKRRIALVAPTYTDAREVMIDGESGLSSIGYPSERPSYLSSRRRLEWPNGAVGHVFSAEEPDGLRGPQFDAAWADEFCAWKYPEYTLSNLRLALRLGTEPRLVVTTTPKPTKALKKLINTRGVIIGRAKTVDNARYLAPTFIEAMQDAYGGTRLGRQELEGEFLEDQAGALWSRALLERCLNTIQPELEKIVVAIDPPVTSGQASDACGLVVAGRAGEGRFSKAYILQDGSVQGLTPEGWAAKAIALYRNWDADYILAEVNQGGEMVRSVLATIDPAIPVKSVYARRSKTVRAEPVAALYEQGRVHHIQPFPELEDELCLMGVPGVRKSPDRADALVWAVTELLLTGADAPRLRHL